ncbi:MAG: UDP-N-acetylmuramoyl-L-alanine--D-glutamate ligase [Ignavibacteria bacterium]|nr:UDP-N-acetylmuramoyl-L-alanine--D-glutamate ligase [Ignavibacteria bacterium]MBI3765961.1 UDP-N-acetylmuramoyl-L-alanine--D-glutamate ligase [Ignavibacteriales bacterium]
MSDIIVTGKKVSVIGAARSGVAVAQLLKNKGARVFVSDSGSMETLAAHIVRLTSDEIEYETGGHTQRVLDADVLVISPGVPSTIPIIREAEGRGLKIVSELEVASWFCTAPIIAITGTNGKTTTTTLVGRMLHDSKRKHVVAGNVGTAFSSVVHELDASSVAVLEVSSFQLEHIEMFHPRVSVLLNMTPDHLDRYGNNFAKYIAAKCRIFENQTKDDFLIYNYDDIEVREHVGRLARLHVHTLPFGIERQFDEGAYVENGKLVTMVGNDRTEMVETEQISIRGIHNLYNSMAATLAAQMMHVKTPSLRATLKNFKGVEHRLEFVREVNGVKYVNDSKATNVDSVWYALQAYKEPLVLLLGGRDKGNDYSRLNVLVEKHVKAIVAIGESAEKVYQAFSSKKNVVRAISMEEAVKHATRLAVAGDIVMLSPACASFDWFQNYEHRGRVFKQIVNSL